MTKTRNCRAMTHIPTLDETRGDGWIAYTAGELMTMWIPPPAMGRRWLWRAPDGALFWVLPDVDGGTLVPATEGAPEGHLRGTDVHVA